MQLVHSLPNPNALSIIFEEVTDIRLYISRHFYK